jgi:hypothetical protein
MGNRWLIDRISAVTIATGSHMWGWHICGAYCAAIPPLRIVVSDTLRRSIHETGLRDKPFILGGNVITRRREDRCLVLKDVKL